MVKSAVSTEYKCRICGHVGGNETYQVREMLYGTRELFDYFQCSDCGCVQISEVPDDLQRHYPENYVSFKNYHRRAASRAQRFINRARVSHAINGSGLLGGVLNAFLPEPDYLLWCREAGIKRDSRIVDIGCGNGKLLIRMMQGGFSNLCGADPFIAEDLHYGDLVIHKIGMEALVQRYPGAFDLVMLHHSFEHMDEPVQVLKNIARLLSPGGTALIRIPVADSYCWEHYRENWFALDPPRHLYLHTRSSMELVARESGMEVVAVHDDATATQFTGSELYQRNIAANAPKETRDIFRRSELQAFSARAKELNAAGRGDQSAYYLRVSSNANG